MSPPLAALKNNKLDRFVLRKTVLFLINKSELFLLNVGLIPIKSPDTTSNHVRSITITKTVRSADLGLGFKSGLKSVLRTLLIAVSFLQATFLIDIDLSATRCICSARALKVFSNVCFWANLSDLKDIALMTSRL